MRDAPTARQNEIVAALITPAHRDRYLTSPSFKGAVDTLIRMLPAWIDGLAAQSDEVDRETALAVEAIRRTPSTPLLDGTIERTDP